MLARLALWLLFAGYAAYAFSLQSLRLSMGTNPAGGDPLFDRVQQVLAVLLLAIVTFIAVTGRRI